MIYFLLKFCVVNWTEAMVRSDLLALALSGFSLLYPSCLNPSWFNQQVEICRVIPVNSCTRICSGGLRREGYVDVIEFLIFILSCFTDIHQIWNDIFDKENKILKKQ